MSKRGMIIGAGVATVGLILYCTSLYNTAVPKQERINRVIANEQVELQRRADLLPNIAASVGAAAHFEHGTFTDVAAARSAAQAVSQVDPTKIAGNPALQKQVIDAQAKIGAAFAKVSAAVESNPTLKATGQFRDLAEDIRGSENRITYARREEQAAYVSYNSYVRHMPRHLFLSLMGFRAMPYYAAGATSQSAPQIKIEE